MSAQTITNTLVVRAADRSPDAMAAADAINLSMAAQGCATWRAGDITGEANAWREARAQIAACAPSLQHALRLSQFGQLAETDEI